jgi:hypothetical protein
MTCNLSKNIGKTDRALRIAVGLLILSAGLLMQNWWGLIGAVPLITGLIRWCPVYVPLNISTD